jgi:hypothetical protein
MLIIFIVLISLNVLIYLDLRRVKNQLVVLTFMNRINSGLLFKKGVIKFSEFDIAINDAIGNMPEDAGNRIIEAAKSIGITIPNYLDEDELKLYLEKQELKRAGGVTQDFNDL